MKSTILQGDAATMLKTLGSESIDCVVTSPPYWGLRDYGTATWDGGKEDCSHLIYRSRGDDLKNTKQSTSKGSRPNEQKICSSCGAIRIDSQLGLEKTPEEYVDNLVRVFQEVKRILKNEGTVWLNLGDSYGHGTRAHQSESKSGFIPKDYRKAQSDFSRNGLQAKQLIGIPWRVALALQSDGWYLRQDIIWAKPNPMPESVTDRCTKSHEYIFLLTKNPRYYFDNESIQEPVANSTIDRITQDIDNQKGSARVPGKTNGNMKAVGSAYSFARKTNNSPKPGNLSQHRPEREDVKYYGKRNKRSVWTVSTKPFRGAHFATFPEDLIVPMVQAGCPELGVVLDPFFGSGTTGVVAKRLNRKYIGIELNPKYIKIAEKRLSQQMLL